VVKVDIPDFRGRLIRWIGAERLSGMVALGKTDQPSNENKKEIYIQEE
jgi:hypothetical protein